MERHQDTMRDKRLVVLAGIAPDIDGIGIVVDFGTRIFGIAETNFYQNWHRLYGHSIFAALAIAAAVFMLADRKFLAAIFAFLNVHLHLLCDIVGSRGTTSQDIWGIYYLSPLSNWEISWNNQWPLAGWQNMLISIILLSIAFHRGTHIGYSPVAIFSSRGDPAFVNILRKWKCNLLQR